MSKLKGEIALVTGASRGVGRGIAHELGLAGATVYVTGRSREGKPTTDSLPGTIDETARLVSESGGEGIAIECDHTSDESVAQIGERMRNNHDRLDILVNNIWGGYEQYDSKVWQLPFWEQPIWRWDKMFQTGVRAHYTTSRALVPLMLKSERPLIVNISFGDEGRFLGDVQYDAAKSAVTRLGFALSKKLKKKGFTVLTIYPGFTRTERVEAGASKKELSRTHSPRFVGRAIVALASDPNIQKYDGGAFKVGQLGVDYGFKDIDGSQPEPYCIPDDDGE